MKRRTWMLIFLLGVFLCVAAQAGNSQARTLHFPKDASLGRLKIRDWGSQRHEDWQECGAARGVITVPEGKELELSVSAENFQHLAELASLGPNDVQVLNILSPDLTDSDLRHIQGLKGLNELLLMGNYQRPSPLRGEGLRYLRDIESLRDLRLHNTSIRDASFEYLQHHTNLEKLHLIGNRNFNGEGFRYLKGLKSLKTLWILNTPIEDSGLAHIQGMTSLEVLTLPGTKVTPYGLAHLQGLTRLKYLTVPNSTTDEGLSMLKGLQALETLRIASNAITDEGLIHLQALRSLISVDVASRTLTGAGLAYLKNTAHLRELTLDIDSMSNASLSHLEGLPVTVLYLTGNERVSDEGLGHIADLGTLKALYLDSTKVTDAGLAHLCRLKSVETLNLSDTSITDQGLVHLSGLSELQDLTLSRTDVGDEGLAYLQDLKSLQRLWLAQTLVGDAGLTHLQGFNSLRNLVLGDTYVSGQGLAPLKALQSLRYLYLTGIEIGTQGVVHLKEMTWLRQLVIDDQAASDTEINALREALPDCRLRVEPSRGNRLRPKYSPESAPSLVGRPLPDMEGLGIDLSRVQTTDKKLLVCLWDMNQRPSRYCVSQLAKRMQDLKGESIVVVVIQAAKIDKNKLDDWATKNEMPFPMGMIQTEEKKTRFSWGVKSLPWLILTDEEHVVQAEGFSIAELGAELP